MNGKSDGLIPTVPILFVLLSIIVKGIARLAYSRQQEIDPDDFQYFLKGIHQLTPTERKVFDLYLDGKNAKEILTILSITENTLKFHNKNIYNKLGVSSRKQLLRYATLMKHQK